MCRAPLVAVGCAWRMRLRWPSELRGALGSPARRAKGWEGALAACCCAKGALAYWAAPHVALPLLVLRLRLAPAHPVAAALAGGLLHQPRSFKRLGRKETHHVTGPCAVQCRVNLMIVSSG